jgi:ACS family glucarate transporter-like MFS transporter
MADRVGIETASSVQQASNTRYWVVVFGMALAILLFIDRVALAQAAPLISKTLHLSKTQMGSVFSAFLLSYALFEVPSAWYGDRIGARRGLLRIVAAWSLFTALTGLGWNYVSMVCVQFLFGMGDAGCFPLITKSFRSWLLPAERTRAQACLWLAGCLALFITASTSITKRDGFRLCLYFVRANAGYALELVQTLDIAILFPVRDDRLCFFLCQT